MMNYDAKLKYLNKRFKCNDGEYFIVIEYLNAKNITIQFDDGTKMFKVYSGNIERGKIKNPNPNKLVNSLKITLYGVGFIGVGNYSSRNNKYFVIWQMMLRRCYDKKTLINHPTYIECYVNSIWHNFQNFAHWSEENYVEGFVLDKDILIKGNKEYGPDTCCFVPQEINGLFEKCKKSRGQYPIGVTFDKATNKFISKVTINGNGKHLGRFNTFIEAFQAYKEAKEKQIKWLALTWFKQHKKITEKVFNAMMNYQVEITD